MAGVANNIIIGAAQVSVGGADIGYTRGGTSVRYEPEVRDIHADQALGVVRKARSSERMHVKTIMLEPTLARMRWAFMQPTSNLSGSTLTLGYNDACWMDSVILVLVAKAPGCGTRTFTFANCVTLSAKDYHMKREEESAFEVEWECLKDSSGHFGTIVDS